MSTDIQGADQEARLGEVQSIPIRDDTEIFISYSRTDRERVEPIANALLRFGFRVWWDRHLAGGAEFAKETEARLESAKAVIVVWSRTSLTSNWVADEATVGRDKGVLIPIAIDDVPPKLGFRQFQTIDFSAWRGDERAPAFDELCAVLRSRVSGAPAAPPRASPARRALVDRRSLLVAIAILTACLIGAGSLAVLSSLRGGSMAVDRSVAVLPFAVLSAGADDAYFADGFAEEILNALSLVPELRVTARTSSFHFRGHQKTAPEIAAALGVAHIVDGSIRRSAKGVRISVQLVRATDGAQIWSSSFDAPPGDEISVQSEVAVKVAESLGVLLDDKAKQRMADARVSNVEAFTAYQKGAALWYDAHGIGPILEGLAAANVEFDRAIELEPRFADAQLMRSDLHFHAFEALAFGAELPAPLGELGIEEHLALFKSEMTAAARDARTPGRRAMAEFALAFVNDDWTGLGAKMDAALASEECIYLHWVARTMALGRNEAATAFAQRRNACDPFDPGAYGTLSRLQLLNSDFAAARETLARGTSMLGARPTYEFAQLLLAALTRDDAAYVTLRDRMFAGSRPPGDDFVSLARALSASDPAPAEDAARAALAIARNDGEKLIYAAWLGDEAMAAELAAAIDREPYGAFKLVAAASQCLCGSPFPTGAAPRFADRLAKGGIAWPPASPVIWPRKGWR